MGAEANSQPVAADTVTTAGTIHLDDLPDYNLKITSNNGTVRSYEDTATIVTVNEVQVIVIQNGITNDAASFKLSYKGEMSQDMDESSSAANIAEEINGFSALSGPVTVVSEGNAKFKVTFDAADGDVAQLEAHATDSTKPVSVVTRENGWSIEGPISANLDTMQAGGTINITAKEVCTFTVNGDADAGGAKYYFCYNGACGKEIGGSDPTSTITTEILDDNGDAILATATATYTAGDADGADNDAATAADNELTDVYAITLPLGKSCDGLEMRVKTKGDTVDIVKSVNKHNNGKVFKITRSFLKIEQTTPGAPSGAGEFTFTGGEGHSALARASTLVVSDKSSCPAKAGTDYAFPFNRVVTGFKTGSEHGGAAAVVKHAILGDGSITDFSNLATSACTYSLQRYVITLDSMPTASAHTVTKTLLYKSPVGSCNVAETTKGTFESYECSNRGACDGKSGLCTCYEGYSGESCQTQTVLV